MPYNGSGTFTLPAGNPVVTGTTISSTVNNNTNSDLANGLSNAVTRNGQSPPTTNLPMGNFKLTGLAAGTTAGDSARYDELILKAPINSPTFTGAPVVPGYITEGIGAAGIQLQTQTAFTTSGTSTAYTLAPSSALANFTASIASSGNMTITAMTMGTIYVGMRITGSGVPAGSYVISGAALSWLTNVAVTIASTTITGTAGLIVNERYRVKFNATSGASPTLAVNGLTAKNIKQYNDLGVKAAPVIKINMLVDVEYDGTDYVILTPLTPTISLTSSPIQPFTATVAASAMTVTLQPTSIDFRSTTPSSGAVTSVDIPTAVTLVIPSGATLGTVDTITANLAIIAINNAGTVVLGVVNIAGGVDLSETGLINSAVMNTASDLSTVTYSTSAQTSKAYRVIGYIESTQATAGAWVTAPSLVIGTGGQNVVMGTLGYGQTWQDVSASRAQATNYYNTTGKPIMVNIFTAVAGATGTITVGGVVAAYNLGSVADFNKFSVIVPPGASYSCNLLITGYVWTELR